MRVLQLLFSEPVVHGVKDEFSIAKHPFENVCCAWQPECLSAI